MKNENGRMVYLKFFFKRNHDYCSSMKEKIAGFPPNCSSVDSHVPMMKHGWKSIFFVIPIIVDVIRKTLL